MSDEERWIVIPRWTGPDGFQHYRDRDPVWIKNYRSLLSSEEYLGLTFVQRGILHGIWLEYAASNRQLRDSTLTLSRRLGQRVTRASLEALNHAGFILFSASKPLAPRYQLASLEREGEIERQDQEQDQKPANATAVARPPAHANGDLEPDPDEPGPSPTSAIELARRLAGRITPAEDHLL